MHHDGQGPQRCKPQWMVGVGVQSEGKGFLGDGNTRVGHGLRVERGGRGSDLGLWVEPSHSGNKLGSHEPSESE